MLENLAQWLKQPMTLQQIEQGLKAGDWGTRMVFAMRGDYDMTSAQIERGLTDEEWNVHKAVAERSDFIPTAEQFARGLNDSNTFVKRVFQNRQHQWEVDKLKTRHAEILSLDYDGVAL
jgi:hypothetical protein